MEHFSGKNIKTENPVGIEEHAEVRPKKVARSAFISDATTQKVTGQVAKEPMDWQAGIKEVKENDEHETADSDEEALAPVVSLNDEERFLLALLLVCGVLGGLTYVPT